VTHPVPIPALSEEEKARFLSKVGAPDENGCMIWQAAVNNRSGFGQFWVQSRSWPAHRVAWAIANGLAPVTRLEQTCHNKLCCNPAHMVLRQEKGTRQAPVTADPEEVKAEAEIEKETGNPRAVGKRLMEYRRAIVRETIRINRGTGDREVREILIRQARQLAAMQGRMGA
jgi:hypothetical protein